MDSANPEVYYRRAVGLLDSLTIRRTSQEMGEFKVQNREFLLPLTQS
jgi:hypothetical protein